MAKLTLDWNKYMDTSIKVAEEGIVMLENKNQTLPLSKGAKVALFGRMQNNYYKSGTGSGGMVNVPYVVTIKDALMNDEDIVLDSELIEIYEQFEKDSPIDQGFGWGKERWSQDEMPVSSEMAERFAKKNDAAVIVIARTAGEDKDNVDEPGAYRLSAEEEMLLESVCGAFEKVIVLLNVGNVIEMNFVDKYKPSAVLYVWQAGMIGARAIANIITGKATPTGKLPDTIAKEITDYPSHANFGKDDGMVDIYAEDIYVGYRYFSTFAPEKVLYPFGHGLSYTTFETACVKSSLTNSGKVELDFAVKNVGEYSGKHTILVFVEAPIGKLGKAKRVLCGFAKTSLLKPGGVEIIAVRVNKEDIASFDDAGILGQGTGWFLEEGTYNFYAGNSVADTELAFSFEQEKTVCIEALESALAPYENFDRMVSKLDSEGNTVLAYEKAPTRTREHLDDRLDKLPKEVEFSGDKGIKFIDVHSGKNTMDEFIAQLEDEDLVLMSHGEGMGSPKVTTGVAGAFGGVSAELLDFGIPAACCSDGPSGMRIDSGKNAFSIPNGLCIAATFDVDLIRELFDWFGIEMRANKIDVILGPGMNIHRHPLNGRNFEYFSEDPFLTGVIASAELSGLHKHKVTGCVKHFCANNREYKRQVMNSVISERALREIYLRGFEKAIKEAGCSCIMTTYHRVNNVFTSSSYDLNTVILREQWGFKGIVMTDWWAHCCEGKDMPEDKLLHSYQARSQNDLYMCTSSAERSHINEFDTLEALRKGDANHLTRADLQRIARNVLTFVEKTPAMVRILGIDEEVEQIDSPFGDENFPLKADVYYNIDENPVISFENMDTTNMSDIVFGLSGEKVGLYDFTFVASSDALEVAQMPMTIFYTSIPVYNITWNGTGGKLVEKTVRGFAGGSNRIYRLHFAQTGVRIKEIRLKFITDDLSDLSWDIP